jgi:hypothetical protein
VSSFPTREWAAGQPLAKVRRGAEAHDASLSQGANARTPGGAVRRSCALSNEAGRDLFAGCRRISATRRNTGLRIASPSSRAEYLAIGAGAR